MEQCATCRHWQVLDTDVPLGLCRRNPPTPILTGMARDGHDRPVPIVIGFFPQTRADVACGEWMWRDGARPVIEADTRSTMQ